MVKSGTDRAKHYANVLNGNIPYLTTKAILRNGKVDVAKISAIAALKDSDGKAIIDSFGFKGRNNILAWRAWRELYFMYYRYQPTQKVT